MIYEQTKGWMTGQQIFDEAIAKYDDCFFVEIGSYYGKSAFYMAEKIKESGKNIKILCIDPYIYGMYGEHRPLDQDWTLAMNAFIRGIHGYGFGEIIFPIISPSEIAIPMLNKLTHAMAVKMVYIDGNHAAKWVAKDIESARTLLCGDGILCGHDYASGEWQEVIDTVDELLGTPSKVVGGDTWVHYLRNGKVVKS